MKWYPVPNPTDSKIVALVREGPVKIGEIRIIGSDPIWAKEMAEKLANFLCSGERDKICCHHCAMEFNGKVEAYGSRRRFCPKCRKRNVPTKYAKRAYRKRQRGLSEGNPE